ncbi:MAG: flagellar biosynthesis anti-sigma factor FlgM [Bryobacteraceae bacterium]
MKINDSNQLAASQSSAARAQQTAYGSGAGRTQQPSDTSAAWTGDNVQLSSLSASIRSQSVDSPERSAHIARVAAAVQRGTYSVDAAAVSRGVVNDSISAR